jgi:hypothetical protein
MTYLKQIPASEPPKESGWYHIISSLGSKEHAYYNANLDYWEIDGNNIGEYVTFWLRPATKAEMFEEMKEEFMQTYKDAVNETANCILQQHKLPPKEFYYEQKLKQLKEEENGK